MGLCGYNQYEEELKCVFLVTLRGGTYQITKGGLEKPLTVKSIAEYQRKQALCITFQGSACHRHSQSALSHNLPKFVNHCPLVFWEGKTLAGSK